LNAGVFTGKAWTLFALHQYPSAIAAAQEALRIEPSLAGARRYLGYSLIMMHRYDEASAELSKLPKDNVQAQAARAMVAAAKGDLKTSDQLIAQMQQTNGDTADYQYAQVYAQRNDADSAIRFLDKAFDARDPGLASLRADPFFDLIRGDPRFAQIIRKVDLSA
jgi:tetratricopeptide (TPR) repeat protein